MGIFDKFKSHSKSKGKDMSDAAEQEINERTGGKYADKVDDAQQRAEGAMGMDRDRSDRPDRPDQP
ncbi:Rv0909 family putative TA system antitoxin [Streptomyces sp. NPDC048275]|uniref:Rv0909 family putative TA system antitoxin n=1 Tax=Streptomyces sp. NPDC048275 TaxID=3155629 RepID=UPI0033C007D8